MSTATDSNILEAIAQARGGDTGAFARIVRQYQSLISGVLFSATGDFHKSEDLAQETFLIAWNKLGELREADHLAAWLCTIARNLAHRSQRGKTVSTAHGSLTDELPSLEKSPDAELLRREQSEMVWSAIGGIEEPYRETLVLYYRSGKSVREIAAVTESSEDAVKQRLVRARKSLKVKLEQLIGDVLTETAPGEVFTYGVIAAITGSAFLVTGQTVLAAGTTATIGTVAVGAASGTAGKSIGFATFWSILGPLAYLVWVFLFIWNSCYVSVRNAPTVQARRFRLYSQFRNSLYIALIVVLTLVPFILYVRWATRWTTVSGLTILMWSITYTVFWPMLMLITTLTEKRYRKIVEHDLGLTGDLVPRYSVADVRRHFHVALFVSFLWAESIYALCVIGSLYERYGMVFSWGEHWRFSLLTTTLVMAALAGAFFRACYLLGEHLIGLCRSQESIDAAPPVVDNPFEVALGMINKSSISVDKKEGNAYWLSLCAWIALGCGALWFIVSFVNWHVAPIPTGICILLFFVFGHYHGRMILRTKDKKKMYRSNAVYLLADALLFLLVLVLQSRSGSLSELWNTIYYGYGHENMVLYFSTGLASFWCLVAGLHSFVRSLIEKPNNEELERRRQEAIANYRPKTGETEATTKKPGFPKWMRVVCATYGGVILAFLVYQLLFPNPMVVTNILLHNRDYDRLIQLEPENSDNYVSRAQDWRRNDPQGAIEDLNTAIRLKPDNALAYMVRAKTLLGFRWVGDIYGYSERERVADKAVPTPEDGGQALADCNEAIRYYPKNSDIWVMRARANELLGDYDAAIADMTEAMRRYQAPIRAFETSGQRVDERGYMYQAIVLFCEKKGDLQGAIAECTKALRWSGEDACSHEIFAKDFYRRRSELYEKLGEHDKANADAEKAE